MKRIVSWLERMLIKSLKTCAEDSLKRLADIDALVRRNNLQNEQWFLDWQDELNKISVR